MEPEPVNSHGWERAVSRRLRGRASIGPAIVIHAAPIDADRLVIAAVMSTATAVVGITGRVHAHAVAHRAAITASAPTRLRLGGGGRHALATGGAIVHHRALAIRGVARHRPRPRPPLTAGVSTTACAPCAIARPGARHRGRRPGARLMLVGAIALALATRAVEALARHQPLSKPVRRAVISEAASAPGAIGRS